MNMAKIYYNRLLCGSITYDLIPAKYQAQVKTYAKAAVESGNLSEAEYEQLFKEPYGA